MLNDTGHGAPRPPTRPGRPGRTLLAAGVLAAASLAPLTMSTPAAAGGGPVAGTPPAATRLGAGTGRVTAAVAFRGTDADAQSGDSTDPPTVRGAGSRRVRRVGARRGGPFAGRQGDG